MKKILSIALVIAASLNASQATINPLQETQAQYLMNQAQFLAEQGVSQENILKIFKQNLTQESLNTDTVQAPRSYLIITAGCVVGIMIGGGVVYYFMNKINNNQQRLIGTLNQQNGVLQQTVEDVGAQNQTLITQNQELNTNYQEIIQANNEVHNLASQALNTQLNELTQGLNFIQEQYEELCNDASIPQPRYTALARINNLLERENTQLKGQLEKLSNDKIIDDFFE